MPEDDREAMYHFTASEDLDDPVSAIEAMAVEVLPPATRVNRDLPSHLSEVTGCSAPQLPHDEADERHREAAKRQYVAQTARDTEKAKDDSEGDTPSSDFGDLLAPLLRTVEFLVLASHAPMVPAGGSLVEGADRLVKPRLVERAGIRGGRTASTACGGLSGPGPPELEAQETTSDQLEDAILEGGLSWPSWAAGRPSPTCR